ncbi:hypothetical protein N2152v2_000040 [Parachlorella kessleri]
MGEEFIDLTVSDSEEARPAKRARSGGSRPTEQPAGAAGPSRARLLDDEVMIVEQEARAAVPRATEVDLGDSELAIIGEAGECYCYVCDCLASQCQHWGKGTAVSHHCNAHRGDHVYKLMRAQRNRRQQEERNPNNTAAAAAGTSTAHAVIPATGATAAAARASTAGAGGAIPAASRPSGTGAGGAVPAAAAAGPAAAALASARALAGMLGLGGGQQPPHYPDYEDEEGYGYSASDSDDYYGDGYYEGVDEDMLDAYGAFDEEMLYAMGVHTGGRFGGGGAARRPAANQPCNLTEMPDPRTDPSLMHLATLEMPCKALGGLTIHAIIKRLAPNGFYTADPRNHHYGDRLCIDNMFEDTYDYMLRAPTGKFLQLGPPTLPPEPAEPGPSRVRQVTIFHFDGRAVPTTYGVTVPKEATVAQIMQAAKPLAGVARDEEFLAFNMKGGIEQAALNAIVPSTQVTDHLSQQLGTIGLWRLPKKTKGGADYPSYAVIYHKKRNKPEGYPDFLPVGRATVVPLGASYANGGRAAERVILERLLRALSPLLKEGAAPVQVDDLLGSCSEARLVRTSQAAYSHTGSWEPFRTSRPFNAGGRCGEKCFSDGKLFLRLEWSEELLERFDWGALITPAVHESASPAAIKPTEDYITAHQEWTRVQARAKALPSRVMHELASASRMKAPGAPTISYIGSVKPLTRVRLDLRPDSADEGEVNGRLTVAVYVWRAPGSLRRPFFKPHDEWENGKALRAAENDGPMQLLAFLEYMLWEDPAYRAMKARIDEWAAKDTSIRHSITGLMEAMERGELPAAPQPAGLTVAMRPYQLQSLQFMLDCERGEGGFRRHFWLPMKAVGGEQWWYSPLLRRASQNVPSMPWGGFCCEEMGLGKTVEVLGLVLANPAPPLPPRVQKDADGYIPSRATLVVCAVSLVGQWMAEAQQKLGGSLRVYMYHGQGRIRSPEKLATEYDIVVTTYATLTADFQGRNSGAGNKGAGGKAEKQPMPVVNGCNANKFPPLGAIRWHRLVLDEAHTVKNATVGHTRACMALQAERRWLCSGTPINTDVSDLLGQFCVLGMAPFNNNNYFNSHVKAAFGPLGGGSSALLYALGQCMIRHTKKQTLGGEEVLSLPPLQRDDVPVVLTGEEQKLYLTAHQRSRGIFQQYLQMGNHQINKHLLQIMALLLPMRRVCSGGALKPKDLEVSDPLFGVSVRGRRGALADLADRDLSLVAPDEECPVCMDNFEGPCITPCHHWFCRECILGVVNQSATPKCPLCRAQLAAEQLKLGVTAAEAAAAAAPPEEEEAAEAPAPAEPAINSESKLQALLKELRAMRRADPSAKALVFSQYMSTIEWLKVRLVQEGFGYRYISGSMPLKQRAKAIQAFQEDPPTTVFLLSMRSGSVGINLTAASHVFLMEPALNPALEEQAVGRSWRMGQTRSVTVKRFFVKGSVEERIMEVVQSRQHNAGGGSGAAGADEAPSRRNRTNVHMQEVAGSLQADRQQLRVSELEILFKDPAFPPPRVPEPPSEDEDDAPGPSRRAGAAARPAGTAARPATATVAVPSAARRSPGTTGGRPQRAAAARAAQQRQQMQQLQQQQEQEGGEGAPAGPTEQQQQQQQQQQQLGVPTLMSFADFLRAQGVDPGQQPLLLPNGLGGVPPMLLPNGLGGVPPMLLPNGLGGVPAAAQVAPPVPWLAFGAGVPAAAQAVPPVPWLALAAGGAGQQQRQQQGVAGAVAPVAAAVAAAPAAAAEAGDSDYQPTSEDEEGPASSSGLSDEEMGSDSDDE